MTSKPLRIILFVLSAFVVLAFTAGVTHAANQLLSIHARSNTVDPVMAGYPAPGGTSEATRTPEPSQMPEASKTPEAGQTGREKVEFSGVITAIDLEWWTIGDYVVQVTAGTELEGSPVVGDMVHVEAVLQMDGSYIADEISVGSGSMEEDDSQEGEHMSGTPHPGDHEEQSGTPEMHDDDQGEDDYHDGSGSGSSEEDHEHDHGGDHGGGGHGGGDD